MKCNVNEMKDFDFEVILIEKQLARNGLKERHVARSAPPSDTGNVRRKQKADMECLIQID